MVGWSRRNRRKFVQPCSCAEEYHKKCPCKCHVVKDADAINAMGALIIALGCTAALPMYWSQFWPVPLVLVVVGFLLMFI
jgi:fatty acid desaturase